MNRVFSPDSTGNGVAPAAVTEDEFHRGAFRVLQPSARGHRSGSDALLIAAGLPAGAGGLLADLGSGAGVAALAALSSNPGLEAVMVERNPEMAALARATLHLPANASFRPRTEILEADVTLTGMARAGTGLADNRFDFAIMNPPYNHSGQRKSPDPVRAEAHAMGAEGLEPWMRTAAAILRPGGMLVLIYRTERLGEVIACSQGRFGGLAVVPLHPRLLEPAGRILVRMTKGSRAPLSIRPGIVMHDASGAPTELAARLINGEARVDFG